MCHQKRSEALGRNGIGGYVPDCAPDGTFAKLQHGPGAYSWCVDSESGIEIPETRVRFITPNC